MSEGSSILSSGSKRQYGTLSSTFNPQSTYILHNVRLNDTLVSIAVHYNTTVQKLKWINRLWGSDISNISVLKVPIKIKSELFSSNSIELDTINKNKQPQTDDNSDFNSFSLYFEELSQRIEKAKKSASTCLENSRLCEIIADCDLPQTTSPLHLSKQFGDQPPVIISKSSDTSPNTLINNMAISRAYLNLENSDSQSSNSNSYQMCYPDQC